MESSRLPVEVCEHIIDLSWQSWHNRPRDVVYHQRRTLGSLTLTCTHWVPRARIYLYRTAYLETLHETELFARTLRNAPHFGELVHELVVDNSEKYIPFAQGLFLRQLYNVRFLRLCVEWSLYPPHYRSLIQQFNVRELSLSRITAEDLCFIWSLSQLEFCKIWSDMKMDQREKTLLLLNRRRDISICSKLRRLELWVDATRPGCIPYGSFGDTFQEFHLSWAKTDMSTGKHDQLEEFISRCTALKLLHCGTFVYIPTRESSFSRLLFLLNAIANPASIETIVLNLMLYPGCEVGLDTLTQDMASLSDEFNVTLARYSSLSAFRVRIDLFNHAWVSRNSAQEMILRHMTMLKDKLIVEVFKTVLYPFSLEHIRPEPDASHRRHATRRHSISTSTNPSRDLYARLHDFKAISTLLTKTQLKRYRRVLRTFSAEKQRRKRNARRKKRGEASEEITRKSTSLPSSPPRPRRKSCCAALGVYMAAQAQRNVVMSSQITSTSNEGHDGDSNPCIR